MINMLFFVHMIFLVFTCLSFAGMVFGKEESRGTAALITWTQHSLFKKLHANTQIKTMSTYLVFSYISQTKTDRTF